MCACVERVWCVCEFGACVPVWRVCGVNGGVCACVECVWFVWCVCECGACVPVWSVCGVCRVCVVRVCLCGACVV